MDMSESFVIIYLVIAGIGTLLSIAARVLLMLAVGEDMKAKGLDKRALWMVITFFVPYCAIVYVIVRKWLPTEVPQYCESCHATVATGAVQCAACGSAKLSPMVAVSAVNQQKKVKTFAIVGAVLYGLSYVSLLVSYVVCLLPLLSYSTEDFIEEGLPYYEEFDGDDANDFFENFEEYPYDEEDFEEFFDNFEEYDYGDMPFDFNDNNN